MQAVIMAGGAGQRLRPLTCTLPKPMVPVMNRPVMQYSIELLKRHGMEDIAVTLQYLPDEVSEFFGDGAKQGVRLSYFVENTPLGTAGSVRASQPKGTFAVISGDALTDVNLEEALAFHREKGAIATLVLKKVSYPLEFGVVLTDASGSIERFLEKPGWGEVFSDLANTGIYILEEEVFDGLEEGFLDFAKDVFPALLKKGAPMFGYVTKDYWCDIGDVPKYLQAHRDILDGKCRVSLSPAQHEGDGIYTEPGARVEGGVVIKGPCYLGANCTLEQGVALEAYTVLGNGVHIAGGASVKRSVLWNGASVEAHAELRGAVACSYASVGAHATAYEGAVLGANSVLGPYARVKPNVYVWPHKRVEAHQARSEHLVWQDEDVALSTGLTWPQRALSPCEAARLGAAMAAMAKGAGVALGCEGSAASAVVRVALASGLMSQGTDVFDLGASTLPMLRYGQRSLGASAGVFVSTGNGAVTVHALDKDGLPVAAEQARKIRVAMQQDVRPVEAHALGLLRMQRGVAAMYSAHVLHLLNADGLRQSPKKAVVGGTGLARKLLVELLTGVRWQATGVEGGAKEVGEEMLRQQADVGFIPSSGERLEVLASDGEKLSQDMLLSLLSLALLRQGAQRLVLPMHSSESLIELAQRHGATAQRAGTKTLLAAVMAQDEASAAVHTDAVAAAMQLCQMLSESGESLRKLLQELPGACRSEASVNCSWKDIGRIFRTLVETQPRESLDLVEGVRVRHQRGWALVMPEVEAARCRILCESASEEYAESLTDMYVKRIQGIVKEAEAGK